MILMDSGGSTAELDQITAGASQILNGYVGLNTDGDAVTGNIPIVASKTHRASTSTVTISAGQYLQGTHYVGAITTGNLSASTIKKGVVVQIYAGSTPLYSITGTYEGFVT